MEMVWGVHGGIDRRATHDALAVVLLHSCILRVFFLPVLTWLSAWEATLLFS